MNNSHNLNNIKSLSTQFDNSQSNLDNYFQTFEPSKNSNTQNFLTPKRDLNSKMEQMMQSRIDKSNEQILDVPEFLKPQNTKKPKQFTQNTNVIQNKSDNSFGFNGDINSGDYTSINDIGAEISANKNTFNSNLSVQERLRIMQEERDNKNSQSSNLITICIINIFNHNK